MLKGSPQDPLSCDNSTDNHLVTLHHLLMLGAAADSHGRSMSAALRPAAARLANPVALFAAAAASPAAGCAPLAPVAAALPPQLELLTLQMLPPGMNISLIDADAGRWARSQNKPKSNSSTVATAAEPPHPAHPAALQTTDTKPAEAKHVLSHGMQGSCRSAREASGRPRPLQTSAAAETETSPFPVPCPGGTRRR